MTVGRSASYDAGIRGKPLGGFPPNPLSLVLTEGVRGSHRVASVMPKGEAFRHQGKDTANKLVDQRLAARSEGYKATEGLSLSASWQVRGSHSVASSLVLTEGVCGSHSVASPPGHSGV